MQRWRVRPGGYAPAGAGVYVGSAVTAGFGGGTGATIGGFTAGLATDIAVFSAAERGLSALGVPTGNPAFLMGGFAGGFGVVGRAGQRLVTSGRRAGRAAQGLAKRARRALRSINRSRRVGGRIIPRGQGGFARVPEIHKAAGVDILNPIRIRRIGPLKFKEAKNLTEAVGGRFKKKIVERVNRGIISREVLTPAERRAASNFFEEVASKINRGKLGGASPTAESAFQIHRARYLRGETDEAIKSLSEFKRIKGFE